MIRAKERNREHVVSRSGWPGEDLTTEYSLVTSSRHVPRGCPLKGATHFDGDRGLGTVPCKFYPIWRFGPLVFRIENSKRRASSFQFVGLQGRRGDAKVGERGFAGTCRWRVASGNPPLSMDCGGNGEEGGGPDGGVHSLPRRRRLVAIAQECPARRCSRDALAR